MLFFPKDRLCPTALNLTIFDSSSTSIFDSFTASFFVVDAAAPALSFDTSHSAAAGRLSRSLLRLVESVLSCTLQCAAIGSRENGGSVACEAEVGTRNMDVGAPRLVLLECFVSVGVHAHLEDREVVQ